MKNKIKDDIKENKINMKTIEVHYIDDWYSWK